MYVESDYDTDLDGKCDLIKVYVQVPRAAVLSGVDGWKAPVLYEARPYNGGMATHLDAVDPVEDSVAFVDVSAKTAHYEDISWLAAAGVTQGWVLVDGTREFRPYAYVARADMAAFLFRLAKRWGIVDEGWQPKGASPFVDVTEKVAHYREVMWLAESGISKGRTNIERGLLQAAGGSLYFYVPLTSKRASVFGF